MSEIVKSVVYPKTNGVKLETSTDGNIWLTPFYNEADHAVIRLNPTELSDATWREFFKANPEITPALAEAKGKSMEELVMLAHCAGLSVCYEAFGWQGGTIHQVLAEIKRLREFEQQHAQGIKVENEETNNG